jgi:uncharacterized membrane protein YqjE
MKTLLVVGIILSFSSFASIIFGVLFKIMHWPGANLFFSVGAVLLIIGVGLIINFAIKNNKN